MEEIGAQRDQLLARLVARYDNPTLRVQELRNICTRCHFLLSSTEELAILDLATRVDPLYAF